MNPVIDSAQIVQAHELYCRRTGQTLRLDYVRERQWYELLRAGFTLEEVRRVIVYLQREIREGRRNVGALKLSNLLQPDRFEEDLNIRRVRLEPPAPQSPTRPFHAASPFDQERGRRQALKHLQQLKHSLD